MHCHTFKLLLPWSAVFICHCGTFVNVLTGTVWWLYGKGSKVTFVPLPPYMYMYIYYVMAVSLYGLQWVILSRASSLLCGPATEPEGPVCEGDHVGRRKDLHCHPRYVYIPAACPSNLFIASAYLCIIIMTRSEWCVCVCTLVHVCITLLMRPKAQNSCPGVVPSFF